MSDGVAGLSAAMRGLIAARETVLSAIAAIDTDIKHLVRQSKACRRLMTVPGVGHLPRWPSPPPSTIQHGSDDPATSVPISAWSRAAISPVKSITPATYRRPGTGASERCSTWANVMLTRYKGTLKLKEHERNKEALHRLAQRHFERGRAR